MSKVKIAELLEKFDIEDANLMVVEDEDDTKRTTILALKRALLGDNESPQNYKFYSSAKIQDLFNSMNISVSLLPTRSEFDALKQQVNNIVASAGGPEKDSEVVAARGTYDTLAERLEGDTKSLETKYIQYPTTEKDGIVVTLDDMNEGVVTITAPAYKKATTVTITGVNLFSIPAELPYGNYAVVDKANNGIKITYTPTEKNFIIPIGRILDEGEYTLYTDASFSNDFVKEGSVLRIIYTDNSVTSINYEFDSVVTFTAEKQVKAFQILPGGINGGMWVSLNHIMISANPSLDKYYNAYSASFEVPANTQVEKTYTLSNCIIQRSESVIRVKAVDTSFNGQRIKDEIEVLKEYTSSTEDYCGLIEKKGDYIYAYNHLIVDSPGQCVAEADYTKKRNSKPSMEIAMLNYASNDQPKFTIVPDSVIDLTSRRFISIQVYIDKTVSELFADNDGIKIMLSSDAALGNPAVNYYYFNIARKSFVQGWNTIKIKLADFLIHGNPSWSNITQINFRVYSAEAISGSRFWINSVIFDQKIKPTVLFAFDGFYDEAFNYQYPYLYTRGIPVTLFVNNKQTLTRDYMNKVAMLHYQYGWELANDGCNPNKETMILDDNARDQYVGVRNTVQWLYDNFTPDVISYSAPFGNMRPITEPILKQLGFKIAKEEADAYCSFFSKEDFVIPMHLMSGTTGHGADAINKKIDEIVDTGQVLCIYTNNVTTYGDEVSVTRASFESIVAHILEYVGTGQLQCLTFSDFYRQCTNR